MRSPGGRARMTPLQIFYLVSTVAIFAIAWLKGGHPERQGTVFLLLAYVSAVLVEDVQFQQHQVGVMATDTILLGGFVWMCVRWDRWWLLVAVACQVLALVAYATMWFDPDITLRSNVVTRWLFGLIQLFALGAGVIERWLAGEAAAFPGLQPRAAKTG